MNCNIGPMHGFESPEELQTCGAKTRSGAPCRNHPVTGKRRCRMHGGAKGSGGQRDNKNALKHGHYSTEAVQERKQTTFIIKEICNVGTQLLGKVYHA